MKPQQWIDAKEEEEENEICCLTLALNPLLLLKKQILFARAFHARPINLPLLK